LLAASLPLTAVPPLCLWEAIRPVRVFLLLLLLLHMAGTGGEPIPPFPLWKITITREGLATGFIVAWRFGLLVISAAYLTMTTSPSELVAGLDRILKPLGRIGIPTNDLTTMVSLALRFVPTLLSEVDRMKEARLARGASLSAGNIPARLKTVISLAIPVVLNSFKRAEEIAVAMEARAYGMSPATSMKELSMGTVDLAAISVVGITSTLVMVL
jgi:energy-coupling factor transporter transmembrane protein EcfT